MTRVGCSWFAARAECSPWATTSDALLGDIRAKRAIFAGQGAPRLLPRLIGFGLWGAPTVAASVELALVLVGAYLYYRAATRLPPLPTLDQATQRRRVYTATGVVTGLMLLSFVTTVLGIG